jgi:flagellar hook assembly protein FlgD
MKKYRRMAALLSAAAFIFSLVPALSESGFAITDPPQIIRPGKLMMLSFTSALSGTADISLVSQAGETTLLYDDYSAKTGQNNFSWDGLVNGAPAAPGAYTLQIAMGDELVSSPINVGEQGPSLTEVTPSGESLSPGTPWQVHISASMAGNLSITLDEENALIYSAPVPAGGSDIPWDGTLNGAPLAPGTFTVILQLTDDTGYTSNAHYIPVTIEGDSAQDATVVQENAPAEETTSAPQT